MYIAKHLVPAGTEVAIGAPIMITVENVNDVKAFESYTLSQSSSSPPSPAKEVKSSPPPAASAPAPSPPPPQEVKSSPPPATPSTQKVSTPPPSKASIPPPASPTVSSPAPSGPWGQNIYKSPILHKLLQEQNNFISKYGASLQQPLTKSLGEK